jgi:membrane protein DedA with SNARE-associated domain
MQNVISTSIAIFLMGMLGIWKAVPLGFALGSQPFLTWLMTSLGATLSAVILYFFGDRIRTFLASRRKKPRREKKDARAARLFEKYGTAGLGFLGCLLMGPNMTMLIGLLIVRSPRKLLYWTVAGILIWSVALTLLAMVSIDLFLRIASWFGVQE